MDAFAVSRNPNTVGIPVTFTLFRCSYTLYSCRNRWIRDVVVAILTTNGQYLGFFEEPSG